MSPNVTSDQVTHLFNDAMIVVLKLAGPPLVVALAIGLIIGIFQSMTSIQEATLSFVPKALGVALTLVLLGPWMIGQFQDGVADLFALIPAMTGRG